jgi:phosphatidate cytidylyltransferase
MRGGTGALAPDPTERIAIPRTRRWNDLGLRVASAAVLIPIALICIWHGGLSFAALVGLAGVGLAFEWVQLCGDRPTGWPACLLPVAILAASLFAAFARFDIAIAALVVSAAAIVLVPHESRVRLAAGLLYLAPATLALFWLRDDPVAGRANLLFLLLLIWASDIGAYLSGRLIGGPRLAPRISAGKTWSGAAGGLLAAVCCGSIAAVILHPAVAPLRLALLCCGLGVVAQLGDLFESMIKRRFGVKDSGRLIPGHGGLLDRLDALLFVAPIGATLALMAEPGVVLWQ